MKKLFIGLLCAVMVVTSLPLAACSPAPAPTLASVRGRLEAVLDASVDINAVLFGAGLPVYERGGTEDVLINRYYSLPRDGRDLVTPHARYADPAEIEAGIRAVYCQKYADSLCEMLFTGYAMGNGTNNIMAARYSKDDVSGNLFQSHAYEPLIGGNRFYDYGTMELDPASNATFLKVNVMCRRDEPGSEWHTVSLTFVPQDGTWFLDGPSY